MKSTPDRIRTDDLLRDRQASTPLLHEGTVFQLIYFHHLSCGSWNRTNGLLVQSQASLPTATTPQYFSTMTRIAVRGSPQGKPYRKECSAGVEPASPGWRPGAFAARPRARAVYPWKERASMPAALRKTESAQWESNPHIRHGKAVGCRYIMGACLVIELPKIKVFWGRYGRKVGWEALESSSAVLQTAARPSQLPAQVVVI